MQTHAIENWHYDDVNDANCCEHNVVVQCILYMIWYFHTRRLVMAMMMTMTTIIITKI